MSASQPMHTVIKYEPDEDIEIEHCFANAYVKVEGNEKFGDEIKPEKDPLMNSQQQKPKKINKKRNLKDLSCDLCSYTTQHKNCLTIHMLGHTDSKPLSCSLCDYKTRFPASLKRHSIFKHDDQRTIQNLPTYNCDMCPYKTYIKCNLKSHQRKHDLSKQFKCPECDYSTSYKHNIVKHSRKHNKNVEIIKKKVKEDATYYCDKCPYVTKYEGHISRHLAKIHFEVSVKASHCEHCSFSTKVGWRLNVHKKRSHQDKPIECTHCEYQTVYQCAYKEHKMTHSERMRDVHHQWFDTLFNNSTHNENTVEKQASELMTMCEIRSKIESDAGIDKKTTNIYKELKMESDNPVYYTLEHDESTSQIPSQSSEYMQSNNYLVDQKIEATLGSIKIVESRNQDRQFQCPTCNYMSKFKASVQRHYQRHHTSQHRPYKCVNCDFSTKTKDQIALHNKRSKSDDIYGYGCKICGFTTLFKCQFLMHEKEHYPYKCVSCEFRCKKKPDMQKHFTIVHLGNGLKCKHCDYRASRKESLLCHEAMHFANKPFQCQLCEYASIRRSLLRNHLNKCHKETIVETIIDDSKIKALKRVNT